MLDYFKKQGRTVNKQAQSGQSRRETAVPPGEATCGEFEGTQSDVHTTDDCVFTRGRRPVADPLSRCSVVHMTGHDMDAHKVDPFNALPIEGNLEFDNGVRWFFFESNKPGSSIPWLSEVNAGWKRQWWDVAFEHAGLFHVLITLGEANRAVVTGNMDTVSWLSHEGRALNALRQGFLRMYARKS